MYFGLAAHRWVGRPQQLVVLYLFGPILNKLENMWLGPAGNNLGKCSIEEKP